MRLLAADGDAWGIPDSAFSGGYVIAALALTIVSLLIRRRVSDGRAARREPHPYEVAYLIGGPRRTIATAVAALYADGAINAGRRGHLCTTGTPAVMSTPLDLAVHGVIREQVLTARQLEARNVEFHEAVWRATHSPVLIDLLQRLNLHLIQTPTTTPTTTPTATLSAPGRWERALAEHEALIAAIRAGDAATAGDVARGHMRAARDVRLSMWRERALRS